MTGDLTVQKAEYLEWWKLNEYDRVPKTRAGKARKLNLSPMTLINWEKTDEFQKAKAERLVAESGNGLSEDEKIKRIDQLLWDVNFDDKKPASKNMELLLKRYGLLVDKSEQKVTIELTASDYAREYFSALKWLRENGFPRVDTVQSEPALLSDEVCVDNQQEHIPQREVGAVGLSTGVTD